MSLDYIFIAFALMIAMMLLGLPIAVSMAAIGIMGGIMPTACPL
ncbi:hypothetical protein [Halomonas sp. SBBP1]|nr:hypothetical protein [Halomonas sp. SBBP1]